MKKWYSSKTVWLNIITTVLLILPMIDANFLQSIGVVNIPGFLAIVATITTVLNTILRVTSTKVISTANRVKNSIDYIK